jgi:hypothetical protein
LNHCLLLRHASFINSTSLSRFRQVRQEGVRLFLIWYQVLGHAATAEVRHMFASLVPGLVAEIPNPFVNSVSASPAVTTSTGTTSFQTSTTNMIPTSPQLMSNNVGLSNVSQPSFLDSTASRKKKRLPNGGDSFEIAYNPVIPTEIEPLPVFNFDLQPRDATCFYLQIFLDYLVSQIEKIAWETNRGERQKQCFAFLFTQFKEVYLKHIFQSLDSDFSYYEPKFEAGKLCTQPLHDESNDFPNKRFQHANTLLQCKAIVVKWFCRYLRTEQPDPTRTANASKTNAPAFPSSPYSQTQQSQSQESASTGISTFDAGKVSIDPNGFEYDLVFKILTGNRENVNLLHQVLGQVFRMPFTQSLTMRKVTMVYRDWIYRAFNRVPLFLQEPNDFTDSEIDSKSVAGGFSPFYRTFIIFSSNVFVQVLPDEEFTQLLDEQVEMCKRVLNIYRYMVMKVDMDRATWEQLLVVILQITSMVLPETIPVKKEQTIGGRLAPAFFETLIVTWIRANLNIHVSLEMWNDFKGRLSRLTKWEELIREWARTMDTLTRVMSRYVYNINLYDLPLDRPVDRKQKRSTRVGSSPKVTTECSVSKSTLPAVDQTASPNRSTAQAFEPNKDEVCLDKVSRPHSKPDSPSRIFLAQKCLSDTDLHQKKRSKSLLSPRSPRPSQSILFAQTSETSKSCQKLLSNSQSWRSKSLDTFDVLGFGQTMDELVSDAVSVGHSRSPSPTSSNNFENIHSLKEMQVNIEPAANVASSLQAIETGISSSNLSAPTVNSSASAFQRFDNSNRSVIAGGFYRNWSTDSAIILWRRMLGILGDINSISNPQLHFLIMECLAKIIEDFIKIRENLCVTIDGLTPVKVQGSDSSIYPSVVPPMEYFVTWLFNATQLPDKYKGGKLIAYKLLCAIALRRHEIALEKDFLSVFYLTIHQGLISYDLDVISVIIKYCGAKLFSFNLSGASCLLYDFTDACKLILYSNEAKRGVGLLNIFNCCKKVLNRFDYLDYISNLDATF